MLLSLFYREGDWGSDLSQLGSGGAEIHLRLVWLESWVVICLGDHQGTLVGVVRAWDVGRVLDKERVKEKNARGGWEEKRKEQRKEVYDVMELKLAATGSRATIDSENRCLFLWDEWETFESPPSLLSQVRRCHCALRASSGPWSYEELKYMLNEWERMSECVSK